MAAPLPPTLAELRSSVMARAGMSASGSVNARLFTLVDEFINKAQAWLYLEGAWVRVLRSTTFASVDGVADYDLPESAEVGSIQWLALLNTEGEPTPILYTDDPGNRRLDLMAPGLPLAWRYIDEMIRVSPAPLAATYPTFVCDYYLPNRRLVQATDRTVIDGEAIVQAATIDLKEHLGTFADTGAARKDLAAYLARLREFSAIPESISPVSRGTWPVDSYNPPGIGIQLPTWRPW